MKEKLLTKMIKMEVFTIAIYSTYFFSNKQLSYLGVVFIAFLWMFMSFERKKTLSFKEVFFENIIRSIPLSFINIYGTNTNTFINWFNFFTIAYFILFLYEIFFKRMLRKPHLIKEIISLGLMVIALCFIFIIHSIDIESVKTFLLLIFYLIFVETVLIQNNINGKKMLILYENVLLIVAVFVLLQRYLYFSFSLTFGRIQTFGSNRTGFGFLNFDYSFLSLLLVTSFFNTLQNIKIMKKVNILKVLSVIIMVYASFVTSARTGIVSLAVVLTIYYIYKTISKINSRIFKIRDFILLMLGMISILFVVLYMGKIRGFSSSGRGELNIQAWEAFLVHPILGNGLSFPKGKMETHNLILQVLSQTGLVFFIPFSVFTYYIIKRFNTQSKEFLFGYLLILTGAMFIPDVLISRFWHVYLSIGVLTISSIGEKGTKREYKIAHLLNSGGISGAEKVAISIIENSPDSFMSFYVSPSGPIDVVLNKQSVRKISYHKIWNLKKLMRDMDIIYAHDFKSSIYASFIFPDKPVISHIHQNPTWFSKLNINSLLYLFASLFISEIVYVSEETCKSFIFSGLVEFKTTVIENYVDKHSITALSREYNIDEFYDLAFLGRLEPVKNPMLFVNLVEELRKKIPKLKTIVVGDGSQRGELERIIEEKDLSQYIEFVGYLENPFPIILNSKVLVMTSIWEGFGLSAVESMILGLPVVASNVGGLRDIIGEDSGFLCDSFNDYIESILLLLENPNKLKLMSQNAKLTSEKFTNKNLWKKNFEELLYSVL